MQCDRLCARAMLLQVRLPGASTRPHCRFSPLQRRAMLLRDIWTVAAEGRLSPREQRKLWALRHVLQLLGKDETQYDWLSKQVLVEGGTHIQAGRRFGNSSSVSIVLVKVGTPGALPGSEAALHPWPRRSGRRSRGA